MVKEKKAKRGQEEEEGKVERKIAEEKEEEDEVWETEEFGEE